MIKHIPSLNALRAFVSVGKHGNLKGAAQALFVTASALSHQIKNMEETLGTPLFYRKKSGLTLTPSGEVIYQDLADAFAKIDQALLKLGDHEPREILNVSMLSTFAMRWFIPRLSDFQNRHPNIEVRISTSINQVDFSREDMDCAIRSGHGQWKGLRAKHLFSETFTPVCSPEIAMLLEKPEDLVNHTLLHARLRPDDWQVWLAALHIEMNPEHEQTFETRNFAIQAAVSGDGVAIIDTALVSGELKSKKLVTPFPQTLANQSGYYFVYPESQKSNVNITIMQNWLSSQLNGKN